MTFFTRSAAAVAALAMTAAPVVASAANPAASLSVAGHTRAATPAAHGSKLGASVPGTTLISIGVLAALVVIVLVATDNNDNSASR